MAMAQQEDSTVMLSTAKHLDAHAARPFAAAQGDKRTLKVTRKGHPMQRRAPEWVICHHAPVLDVTRKGHPMQRRALSAPLPSGIQDLCLRLMLIGPL